MEILAGAVSAVEKDEAGLEPGVVSGASPLFLADWQRPRSVKERIPWPSGAGVLQAVGAASAKAPRCLVCSWNSNVTGVARGFVGQGRADQAGGEATSQRAAFSNSTLSRMGTHWRA